MRLSYRSKLMLKKLFRILLILLAVALVAAIVVLIYVEPFVIYDRTGAHLEFAPSTEPSVELQAPETRPVVENPQIIYSVGETAGKTIAELGGYTSRPPCCRIRRPFWMPSRRLMSRAPS